MLGPKVVNYYGLEKEGIKILQLPEYAMALKCLVYLCVFFVQLCVTI